MKRFNWKLLAAVPLVVAMLASCKKPTDKDDSSSSYPSDNISVSPTQNVYLAEITSVECPSCPPTAELMQIIKARNPGRIIPMSLHADTLYEPSAVDPVASALGIDQTNPILLFINQIQYQAGSDPVATVETMIETGPLAAIGVGHTVRQVDSAWLVYPKVEFYDDLKGDYYIQSYILMGNIVSTEYGSVDLTQQTSGDPRLSQGSNGVPTKWLQAGGMYDSASYLYPVGANYVLEDILLAQGVNDTNLYGIPLSTVSPLGANYFIGDVFGNQYTPMEIPVPKPIFNWPGYLNASLKVVTIVWERFEGSPDTYIYVNGYYSNL